MKRLLLATLLLLAPALHAQPAPAASSGCGASGDLLPMPTTAEAVPASSASSAGCGATADLPPLPGAPATPERTAAEARVAEILAQDGVHVVHFWAPWCPNSVAELRAGWYEVIERHPDVSFTFVTIWNDGASGRETLDRFAIPARVEELTQADRGPSAEKPNRRRTFLDLPVTWVPTTWVFHKNGELAVAFNYGEVEPRQVDEAIGMVQRSWSHSTPAASN